MNFAIEVAAEANPLNTQTLYNVLQSASSSDQQQVKTGAQQLQNWEKSPSFYSSLQSLYIHHTLPVELRYLAIIQLKNGIDKYWRKTAVNAIKAEEKAIIRSRSLSSCIDEPDHRLALQISILVAKIVRYEYPHDWPDVIDSILESLRSDPQVPGSPSRISRSLLILLYIIKELSTARLQRSRTKLQSITPQIVQTVSAIYVKNVTSWINHLRNSDNDSEGGLSVSMDCSLLALRILRRLTIAGYDFPNRQQEMRDIWSSFTRQFGEILILTQLGNLQLTSRSSFSIEKHILQIAKLHLAVARDRPIGFALLPSSLALAQAYWTLIRQCGANYGSHDTDQSTVKIGSFGDADSKYIPLLEKLALKGLLILRACSKMVFSPAQTFKYTRDEDKEEKKLAREMMKNGLLSKDFAGEMMETLVSQFFVFTTRDLKEWEEEPDEWEKSQESGGEDWEFSIRTCAEKLFLDLIINFKELLVQPLMTVFATVASVDNTEVMLKDSIYGAIGLAAPILVQYPEFDIGSFFENVLVQEVQRRQPGYNILRRRAAIILGHWLSVKEGLNRPLVYQIFRHLLNQTDPVNDQVVRITAARQLKNVIDPFEFLPEQFIAYAPAILDSLIALIQETELTETKIAILGTMSVIVDRMEQSISPFAGQIVSLLPALWAQAGEEYLMKQKILGILSSLCTSMRAESQSFHPLITPLIQSSVEPDSETRAYLLEDALDLWATVLNQTPSDGIMPEIVNLVQYLFPLYEVASENLRKALEITESYLYLVPAEILSNPIALLGAFTALLGSVKRDASEMITSLLELLIRSADNLGGVRAVIELAQSLVTSGIMSNILSGLRDAYLAQQTTGPNRQHPRIASTVETDYLNVLARLTISNAHCLLSTLDATSYDGQPEGEKDGKQKIDWLLTEWFNHMDTISHPEQRKLNTMALTSLLQTAQPWILVHLQSLMNEWTITITELIVDASTVENVVDNRDCLVYNDPQAPATEGEEAPADQRKRSLTFKDPVHRIDIRDFIREKLARAIEAVGGMQTFQREWVGNIDADVLSGFSALGVV